jgi:hypothetical protein
MRRPKGRLVVPQRDHRTRSSPPDTPMGLKSTALTTLNIVVLRAIPSASEATAGTVKAGTRLKDRTEYRR